MFLLEANLQRISPEISDELYLASVFHMHEERSKPICLYDLNQKF